MQPLRQSTNIKQTKQVIDFFISVFSFIAEKSRTLIGLKCDFCPSLRYTLSEYTKYSFARDALTGTKIPILNLQGNPEKEFLSEKGVAKRSNTGVLQATRLSLRRKVDLSTMSVPLFSAILYKIMGNPSSAALNLLTYQQDGGIILTEIANISCLLRI